MPKLTQYLLLALLLHAPLALAIDTVPPLINYQGTLTDENGAPVNGTRRIEFSIYDAPIGGNRVWGPQVFDAVPVIGGRFNVILGSTDTQGRVLTEAFNDPQRYLDIHQDETDALAPRQRILSAPYALVAERVRGDEIYTAPETGHVGIGTGEPDERLTVNGLIKTNAGIIFPDGTQKTTARLPPPDFETDWFRMRSQAGVDSYKEIEHGLGAYPSRVKVLAKPLEGPNEGFVFEGVGAQVSDDYNGFHSGIVFAYNETLVRLWAPDINTDFSLGRIVGVRLGWGGEINTALHNEADVKVKAWR